MSKGKTNVSDILSAIEQVSKENLLDVYVPSLARHVKFSPLRVNHQKKIIQAALESASLGPTYNTLLGSEIIDECCTEPRVSLYAIDRDPILIGLRAQSLGTDTTVQNESGDDIKYDIGNHVKAFDQIKPPPGLFETKHVVDGVITLVIQSPTLKRDDDVNKHTIPDKQTPSNKDDIKNLIGEAITYEYIKYIKEIKIGEVSIEFDSASTKKFISVVESLPMSVSKKLILEINKIKDFERKFTQIIDQDKVLTVVTDARFYHSE